MCTLTLSLAPGLTQPAIANAPLPAEGNGSFSNLHLALLLFFTPAILLRLLPFVKASWVPWWLYFILMAITGVPVACGYWTIMSMYGSRKNDLVELPGRECILGVPPGHTCTTAFLTLLFSPFPSGNIEEYITIKDAKLKEQYHGRKKIPMQVFYDAYFEGKIDIKGDMLDLLEYRWDWAEMRFTLELFRYVIFNFIPDIALHTAKQDETQIRDNYDREGRPAQAS